MAIELDHLFVWTSPGAPELDRLLELGFVEGRSNTHPGQGTACRCLFLRYAYLEFLWIADREEACSSSVEGLHLWERSRWRENGASPFGIGLRTATVANAADPTLPFSSWEYRPSYYPPETGLSIATNSAVISEPLLFHGSRGRRPDHWPAERQPPTKQADGANEIGVVRLHLPQLDTASVELRSVQITETLNLLTGDEPLADVVCNGGSSVRAMDLRPELPLLIRW